MGKLLVYSRLISIKGTQSLATMLSELHKNIFYTAEENPEVHEQRRRDLCHTSHARGRAWLSMI